MTADPPSGASKRAARTRAVAQASTPPETLPLGAVLTLVTAPFAPTLSVKRTLPGPLAASLLKHSRIPERNPATTRAALLMLPPDTLAPPIEALR